MKRPRWNAGAASWRLHRAHTAKPLMSVLQPGPVTERYFA